MDRSRQLFSPVHSTETAYVSGLAVLKATLQGHSLTVPDEHLWQTTGFTGAELTADQLVAALPACGLSARRTWLPLDSLSNLSLPLIVSAQSADLPPNYILIWQHVGPFWQVMDPRIGRRWLTASQLQLRLHPHDAEYSFDEMETIFDPEVFSADLEVRLQNLLLPTHMVKEGLNYLERDWQELAALDAIIRFLQELVQAGSLRHGQNVAAALRKLLDKDPTEITNLIPATYWTFRRGTADPNDVAFHGLQAIQVLGHEPAHKSNATTADEPPVSSGGFDLRQYLGAPEQIIWQVLREDGWLAPASVIGGLLIASIGLTVEIFLLQGLLQLGQQLNNATQRGFMLGLVIVFFITLLLLLMAIDAIGRQQGRRIEVRLRIAFLEKIPRLPIWFFQRSQVSGLTQRGYTLRSVHALPDQAQKFLQTIFQIFFTAAGVIWLEPSGSWIVILLILFTVTWPYFTQPLITQHSLGLAQENNTLGRIYLDALLGVMPVRVHSAESTVWRRHQSLLVDWVQINLNYFSFTTIVQVTGLLITTTLTVGIVLNYVYGKGEIGAILLISFWAINIPVLGQRLVESMQEYLQKRAIVQMLMQPLNIPDATQFQETLTVTHPADAVPEAVRIELKDVKVAVDETVILTKVNLQIEAGEHLAIVGPSGAGKSTLASLLLGWQAPQSGEILIDGEPLTGEYVELLRRETAWLDPAVQLWNRSLLYNLWYANPKNSSAPIGDVVEKADLFDVLETLPHGLQTMLGENGRLLSGGQGQRVRLGRAILQENVRLVILDEPFRGLDREKRKFLLSQARAFWPKATLICITHDVSQTEDFKRVLVIENGQIAEDDSPENLKQRVHSRYRDLLQAEDAVRRTLWESADWKRLYLDSGHLTEEDRHKEQDGSGENQDEK